MNTSFDFLIIGSGISGLTIASILSKEGFKIALLEKNSYVGGNLSSFYKDKTVFDTGVHYTGGFEQGRVFDVLYRYLGIRDKINIHRQDLECFDKIIYQDEVFDFAQGYDRHIEKICQYFPDDCNGIRCYFDDIQYYGSLNKIEKIFSDRVNLDSLSINVTKQIKSNIKNEKLFNILTSTNSLYGGQKAKTPFVIHAHTIDAYINDSWKFIGGAQHLADALADSIRENGGEIFLKEEVQEIVYTANKVSEVLTKQGHQFQCKNLISSLHPQKTLSFVPQEKLRKSYRNRINNLENTSGMFSLFLVMKKNSLPYMNHNLYYYDSKDTWLADNYTPKKFPEAVFMFSQMNSPQQKFSDGIVAMTYMPYDEVKQWSGSLVNRRGGDYKAFKEEKTEQLLSLINRAIPNYSSYVQSVYSSTPLTYENYYGMPEGGAYGISKDCNKIMETSVMPYTKTPNLFLIGQSVSLHGLLGSTVGSILLASQFLGKELILNRLTNISS